MADDDPGERGTLTIRNRAATRIVELATLDVPEVLRRSTRFGTLTGRELPRAVVDMTPEHPNIRVDIAVRWPSPIAAVCRQVRSQVIGEVSRLTGRAPSRVDIAVIEVVTDEPTAAEPPEQTGESR